MECIQRAILKNAQSCGWWGFRASLTGLLLSMNEKPTGAKRKRVDGGGRKPLNERMEEIIQEWIHERR